MGATDVRSQCEVWLKERWGEVRLNQHGALVIPEIGRTACWVECSDLPEGLTRVNIHSMIVMNVTPSPNLFKQVAMFGTTWKVGALTVYEEDGLHVEFDYSLLGEGLTAALLNYYVEQVSTTALGLIDTFQENFGGQALR